MPPKFIICFVVLLAGVFAHAENPVPVIREEHAVLVDGVEERWRLEWVSPPKPVCSPDDSEEWRTCPCTGFAFGERGNLVLVRKKPGQADERFDLNKLFAEGLDAPAEPGEAVLRRWDVDEKDLDEKNSANFASHVRARPNATVMRFGDYDHDGRATEFLLQVGTFPCGKKMCVAVGVSRHTPHLHVFSTVAHPERPLILQDWQWESLLRATGPIKVISWRCADHGSDTETELELSIKADGIHATNSEYQCDGEGSRGRLLNKEDF
jgi:hypothetical protein